MAGWAACAHPSSPHSCCTSLMLHLTHVVPHSFCTSLMLYLLVFLLFLKTYPVHSTHANSSPLVHTCTSAGRCNPLTCLGVLTPGTGVLTPGLPNPRQCVVASHSSNCLPARLPASLPACPPTCLPACLPACLSACLPLPATACLPACLPTYLPATACLLLPARSCRPAHCSLCWATCRAGA